MIFINKKKLKKSLLSIFEQEDSEEQENILSLLVKFVKDEISSFKLEDSDPFIKDVWTKSKKGQSLIEFDITLEDFFESLDVNSDDLWFINIIQSSYSDFTFQDQSNTEEDFREGYGGFYSFLDEDNMKILEKLSVIFLPGVDVNFNDRDYLIKFNEGIITLFPSETQTIIWEYWSEEESMRMQAAREHVDANFFGKLKEYGFSVDTNYDKVYGKIANLIYYCKLLRYKGDLKGLFDKLIGIVSGKIDTNFYEDYYQYYDESLFDRKSYNSSVYYQLSKIEDKINEDGNKIQEFAELIKRIRKISPTNTRYKVPKDKTLSYMVTDFNYDDFTIKVEIRSDKGFTNKWFSEENFYNFLYHPELFDLEY
jgi:hypothetical protein